MTASKVLQKMAYANLYAIWGDFFGIIYEIYFLAASARLSYHLSLGVEDMEMRRLVSCQEPIIERESAFDLFFDIVWEVIEEVYAGGLFYFIDR